MSALFRDADGREVFEGARVVLTRDIQMERLFAGYDAALGGAALPRDLKVGDVGTVIGFDLAPEPLLVVEFSQAGVPFWRGGLKPDEVRREEV